MEEKECFGDYDSSRSDCMFCEQKEECKKKYEEERDEFL